MGWMTVRVEVSWFLVIFTFLFVFGLGYVDAAFESLVEVLPDEAANRRLL